MKKQNKRRDPARPRNPMAAALASPIFRKRIVDRRFEVQHVRCKASLRRSLIREDAGSLCSGVTAGYPRVCREAGIVLLPSVSTVAGDISSSTFTRIHLTGPLSCHPVMTDGLPEFSGCRPARAGGVAPPDKPGNRSKGTAPVVSHPQGSAYASRSRLPRGGLAPTAR